jgi:hypothetical protein
MRRRVLGVVLALPVLMASAQAGGDCPPCGPMQCTNDPAFAARRDAKKQALIDHGASAQRAALVDNDGPCRLCLENGPDGFTLLVARPDGEIGVGTWTAEQEAYARQDLKAGKAKSAFVMYARERCACCGEKPANQQSDWDPTLRMSKSLAIALMPSP